MEWLPWLFWYANTLGVLRWVSDMAEAVNHQGYEAGDWGGANLDKEEP